MLNGGDLGPFPLLEELHPGGVVQRGRRVGAEEGGETLSVRQSRRAGAVRQLREGDTKHQVIARAILITVTAAK